MGQIATGAYNPISGPINTALSGIHKERPSAKHSSRRLAGCNSGRAHSAARSLAYGLASIIVEHHQEDSAMNYDTELAAIRGSNSQLRLSLARNCDECIFEFFNRIGRSPALT